MPETPAFPPTPNRLALTALGGLTVATATGAVLLTLTTDLDPPLAGLLRGAAAVTTVGFGLVAIEWRIRQRQAHMVLMLGRIAQMLAAIMEEVQAIQRDQPAQADLPVAQRTRPIPRERDRG